ncbi:unnamed protein product [Ilex paraguariensis]|uniref:F-box associated beta-propeller type 3 domain-containing protein n=1 Tax=Ilex paraguariensis TaxID=185542 RepID=A0ABC8S6T3_9AQUA
MPLYSICSVSSSDREKVICTTECEILTLSKGKDASWRRFGAAPYKLWTKSLYVNGALYWKHPLRGEHGYEFVLIVLYLKDESFHEIPPIRVIGRENDILEFQGHLALVGTTGEDHNLHLWLLEDIEGQPRSWSWTHIVITVPRDSIGRTSRYPAESLSSTGEILMTNDKGVFKSDMHICSYDQTKQKVDKFVICKSLSLPSYNWKDWNRNQFGIYYYEETMTPLNKLVNNPVH